MVRDITAGKQFEMDRLALDSSDIRKRAARLQSSLALIERTIPIVLSPRRSDMTERRYRTLLPTFVWR